MVTINLEVQTIK